MSLAMKYLPRLVLSVLVLSFAGGCHATARTAPARATLGPAGPLARFADSVVRGTRNRHAVVGAQGLTVKITLTSLEGNAAFSVEQPDGREVPGTEEERDLTQWTGTLPRGRDPVIRVGATRGNASYTLTVERVAAP